VQAVGAHHQVEVAGGAAVLEGDPNAHAVVVERPDRVAEDRLHLAFQRAVDDGGQVAAGKGHVTGFRTDEQLRVEREHARPVAFDLAPLAGPVSPGHQLGGDAHSLGDHEPSPPEVDDVSARPKRRGPLDQRRRVARAQEPVSERGARDA
jgi:hypothetical protein